MLSKRKQEINALPKPVKKLKIRFLLLAILLGMFLLRLPSCFTPLWNVDEAVSACIANVIVDGGVPYLDAIDHRGPVTYYAYALIFQVFGKNNMQAIHIGLSMLLLCVAIVIYACGAFVANTRSGLFATLCWGILSFGAFREGDMLAAHTEYLVVFFTAMAAYCLLRSISDHNILLLVLCGACYGIAFFAKQPAALDLVAAFAFLALLAFFRKNHAKLLPARLFFMTCGFLFVGVCVFTYFYTQDAFQDLFFYFWTYNTRYYVTEAKFLSHVRSTFASLKHLYTKFFFVSVLFFSGSFYSIYDFFIVKPRYRVFSMKDWHIFFVLLSCAAVLGASLSGRAFGHYYIQLLPALCIISGIAVEKLHELIQGFFTRAAVQKYESANLIVALVFIACCLSSPFLPLIPRLYHSMPNKHINEQEENVVQYIKSTGTKDERMFVWGFYPEIYVLSERMPASRYTFTNVLTGLIPWTNIEEGIDTTYAIVPGTWDILMRELHQNKPSLIVDTSPVFHRSYGKYDPQLFPRLHDFLQKNYLLGYETLSEDRSLGFKVYKRRTEEVTRRRSS